MPSSRSPRPVARRLAGALAAAGALALALTGCVGQTEPIASPPPTTDVTEPIFASDEEALAAAEQAFRAFTAISDDLGGNPESDPADVRGVVTTRYAPEFISSLEQFRGAGLRTSGAVTRDRFTLVQHSTSPDGIADIQIYACVDYSETQIVNEAGQDVTPKTRVTVARTLVHLLGKEKGSSDLVVDSTELWADSSGC